LLYFVIANILSVINNEIDKESTTMNILDINFFILIFTRY
jgi:hypothetical protein